MENTNTVTGTRMVSATFEDRDAAEQAFKSLENKGYTKDDINLIMNKDTRKRYFDNDEDNDSKLGSKAMEGAGKGSAIGGSVGAVAGVIAALGTNLIIPGLGLVIAGPIAAGLAGAGAGGLTGGLIGALVGSGIPEEHAKQYETRVKEGRIVMSVKARSEEDAEDIEESWRSYGAADIY
jgi:hypothetical protein